AFRDAEQCPVVHRLEGELLFACRRERLDLGERGARLRGQHKLRRLVERDPGEPREVERRIPLRRPADAPLGAPADHLQRLAAGKRPADRLLDLGGVARLEVFVHQNRGRSGNATRPEWTCICPSSAQRCSVGNTFPGLSRPLSSNAHLRRCCWSRSACENITGIRSRFSTPTPCSPVSTPPTSTQSRRISAPNSSARSSSPGLLASKMMSGCRLPSPAWNTLQKPRSYSFAISAIRARTSGSARRGMVPSMH